MAHAHQRQRHGARGHRLRRTVTLTIFVLTACARPAAQAAERTPPSTVQNDARTTPTISPRTMTPTTSTVDAPPGTEHAAANYSTASTVTPTIFATRIDDANTPDNPSSTPPSTGLSTPPESDRTPRSTSACISSLPLLWRVGQTLMPSVYSDNIAAAQARIKQFQVGGAIVMTWHDGADPGQLDALKHSVNPPLMLATDEEGGRVQRFRQLGVLPSQRDAASTLTTDAAQHMIATHAVGLAALGIDVVFGPVVDVGDQSGPIGDRAFADDPETVTTYASAYIRGWQSAGIVPVIKHFPGHGHANADTHTASASTPMLSTLRTVDAIPFERLRDSGAAVMVGHLIVPDLTDGQPASVSAAAVQGLLRNQLGYGDALIFSDGLEMDAVTTDRSPAQAGVAALRAGVDVLVFIDHANIGPMVDSITDAVASGALAESRLNEAVEHVLGAKGVDACDIDVAGR